MSTAHDAETAYLAISAPPEPSARPRISGARDACSAVADIWKEQREHFIMLSLDVRHRLIAKRTIAIGSLTGVEVHPRECFRPAIADGAAAVVFLHNHPSGDPSPSRQDVELTARLRQVGEICGIPVLDHVVVADGGFVSLADRGWV